MAPIDRRTLLVATAGLATLAGCRGGGETATGTDAPVDTGADGAGTTTATETTRRAPGVLKRRAREFLDLLAAENYEGAAARLAGPAAEQFDAGSLAEVWTQQVTGNFGDYVAASGLTVGEQNGMRVVAGAARFERATLRVIVTFDDEGVTGFRVFPGESEWTAPSYVDRSAFTERTLELETPACPLGASLTVPAGDGRVPGVVLVHGSGPNDRDETVGANRIFKDLAWGLSSRGVAVLRYDKRTAACDVELAEATLDEVVTDDALTAVDRLREVERVPGDDVVLVGHSLGATLAPRIAARDGGLAGVVMLAAVARAPLTAVLDQTRYLIERDGTVTDAERSRLDAVREQVRQLRSGSFPDDGVFVSAGDEYWADLGAYDPVATAEQLSVPRLVLQGRRDYQVTPEEDFARWQTALGGEPNVTLRAYDRLNHLFIPGEGAPGPGEYVQPGNVARRVLADIVAFIERNT